MNKSTSQKTGGSKAAHSTKTATATGTGKSPTLERLTLKMTPDAACLLKSLAILRDTTPENYTLEALCSALKCDAESLGSEANQIISKLGKGARQ